jgi:hypothetical protein
MPIEFVEVELVMAVLQGPAEQHIHPVLHPIGITT